MNEEEEGLGFDEFRRKKRGSGKAPSPTNPKGAGRPSDSWRRYQRFLEWEKLEDEGFTPRNISEIFRGIKDNGERSRDGVRSRDYKGFMGRILEGLGLSPKTFEAFKFDKVEEKAAAVVDLLAPHVLPYAGAVIAIVGGWGIWYAAESLAIWTERGLTPELKEDFIAQYGEHRIVNITSTEGKYNVTYKLLPQFWHRLFDMIAWAADTLGGWANSEHGLKDYAQWVKEKPASRALFQGYFIYRFRMWRQKQRESD